MTDGNTYAISKHLDKREDYDALQEVTAELEQAEARIEELQAKLAKAVEFIEDLTGCEWPYCEDAKRVLAELRSDLPVDKTRESQKGDRTMSDDLCPSCREPISSPSGDGCAAMNMHQPTQKLKGKE